MAERTVEQRKAMAREAKDIVESEVFCSAVEQTRDTIVHEWMVADTKEKREVAHAKLQALQGVVDQISSFIIEGKIIDRIEKRRERVTL